MSQLSELSPKEKAQTGMSLIKSAIGQVLAENKDRWPSKVRRSKNRAGRRSRKRSGPDPPPEPRKPAVGSPAHPRRTLEVGHRCWRNQCRQEQVIGTIQRECLDQVIVFNETSLYRHLQGFLNYYHASRTHLSLDKDPPEPRPVQGPELGQVVALPQVGGLHHRYERRAA